MVGITATVIDWRTLAYVIDWTRLAVVLGLVGIALVGMAADPLGIGEDPYLLTVMGVGFGIAQSYETETRAGATAVFCAGTLGGVLMGVGALSLSHPLVDPVVVGETTVAEGGVATVVGFVLVVSVLLVPAVRDDAE